MNRLTNLDVKNKKSKNILVFKIVYEKFTLPCDVAMLE